MTEYLIDLTNVRSFADFVAAFNEGMIDSLGYHWTGNLDAFNDYLYWPTDGMPQDPYRLILIGWGDCAKVLEHHTAPDGRSMLDVIDETFKDNPQAKIVYK